MEINKQKEAFISYEADAWFERNKSHLLKYEKEADPVVDLIEKYKLNPKSLLEIGCSFGHRLNGIKQNNADCEVYGIEPSEKAIAFGKEQFKFIKFEKGVADNLEAYASGSMDIVIVGFVFYVIDRNIVFKVVSEIDRVLKNGGVLIIVDFFSETAIKNRYQHIKEFSAFSFKQNYDEIFTVSKLYYLLDKTTLNHETHEPDAAEDYCNKFSISLLKKDTIASYR